MASGSNAHSAPAQRFRAHDSPLTPRREDLNVRSSRLEVETILADHRRYVDTERKEGARADFSFVELCGVRASPA